jgi:hypothetical protein
VKAGIIYNDKTLAIDWDFHWMNSIFQKRQESAAFEKSEKYGSFGYPELPGSWDRRCSFFPQTIPKSISFRRFFASGYYR